MYGRTCGGVVCRIVLTTCGGVVCRTVCSVPWRPNGRLETIPVCHGVVWPTKPGCWIIGWVNGFTWPIGFIPCGWKAEVLKPYGVPPTIPLVLPQNPCGLVPYAPLA